MADLEMTRCDFRLDSGLRPERAVFIDKKPAYYAFSNETKDMTGAEVFSQHAKNSD